MTRERFEELFQRALKRIPDRYKRGVTAFFTDQRALRQKGTIGLYILGHYHADWMGTGPAITLYYGSFRRVLRGSAERVYRREIAKTLAHELLHHWERQSGIDDLGEADRLRLALWKKRLGQPTGDPTGRDFLEASLFLFVLFLLIGFMTALTQ